MSRSKRFLCSIALLAPVLALSGVSHKTLAWDADKSAPWVGNIVNGPKCDGDQIPYGPYDYLQRAQLPSQLEIVESNHFTTDVETLTRGKSSTPLDDIHYTLQAWPNHHRALNTSVQYRLQHPGKWQGDGMSYLAGYPAECYLQRAINFSPNDAVPYILHGMLMHKMKQYQKALASYREATRLLPNDILTQYNMGLTLVALKKYKEAVPVARRVYAANFPLPGLKNKLIAAGHWESAAKDAVSANSAPKAQEAAAPKSIQPEAASAGESPKLTEDQLAAVKQAMLEKAARKKAGSE